MFKSCVFIFVSARGLTDYITTYPLIFLVSQCECCEKTICVVETLYQYMHMVNSDLKTGYRFKLIWGTRTESNSFLKMFVEYSFLARMRISVCKCSPG